MTTSNPPKSADDIARIIVLIYGMLENGNPFWVYVAVRPSQYKEFLLAHKNGTLDLHQFDIYGEIVVSGEGRQPPDEVTLKVADMYQTDPATLFQPIDPEAEVERKMKEWKEKTGES